MKPDNKTIPLVIALAVGIAANVTVISVATMLRPAPIELRLDRDGLDTLFRELQAGPLPAGLRQLRDIANMVSPEFTWLSTRHSAMIEDCRIEPNRSFLPCHTLPMPAPKRTAQKTSAKKRVSE